MTKVNHLLVLSAAFLLGGTCLAAANPITIDNTPGSQQQTLVEAAALGSGTPDSFFGGSTYWGANIGGPSTGGSLYQTTGLTASYSSTGNGAVTLVFNTLFTGSAPLGQDSIGSGRTVYAADIFLKSNASNGNLTSAFDWGISLGYTGLTGADGGVCAAAVTGCAAALYGGGGGITSKTSEQVWGAGSGTTINGTFGGGFAPVSAFTGISPPCNYHEVVPGQGASTCSDSEASPTVLTGGAKDTNVNVNEAWNNAAKTLTVTLAGANATGAHDLQTIFSDFDIFWGTGDCSNAPIWGNIAGLTSVPEPSSLALLATAAIGLGFARRRKRKAEAAG
jgi:hypothetical protein